MYSQEFVNLVMGDRGIYPIPYDKNGADSAVDRGAKMLLDHGYAISNLMDLKTLEPEQINEFLASFKPETKSGFILRKGFAKSKNFKDYSDEEWRVIFAQYSLTYGWANEFGEFFGESAGNVIADYNNSEQGAIAEQIMQSAKVIQIGFRSDTVKLMTDIMESKIPLRTHQIATLEACPGDVLVEAFRNAHFRINETKVKVIKLCLDYTGPGKILGFFRTPTDVLRYILSAYADEPFEGQITKPALKNRKVHIPTSARKWLTAELNDMRSAKVMCEDMFAYESYWKLLYRYLRFGKTATSRKRFPKYHEAMDLLFDGDRSWTFNGRYSAAIESGDYAAALEVAKERPGFLFRNMLNFLRYPAGTKIASVTGPQSASLDPMADTTVKVVQKDSLGYFTSGEFIQLISKTNSKLTFQLLEQLKDPSILKNQSTRIVQGMTKRYSTPLPGIKKGLVKKVKATIQVGLGLHLQARNVDVGKVYIDKSIKDSVLQYSGRTSTELNYSGTFLSPGTKIDIPNKKILRLGIMWRGPRSTDLDHNCSAFIDNRKLVDVYFGHPVHRESINSSGDITSCGKERFSSEFIDIDLEQVRAEGITSLITSLISFSGNPISDCETYLFINGLTKKERKMRGRSFDLDLMDTEYAVRLDPDQTQKSISYLGFSVNLAENKIAICAATPQDAGFGTTVRNKGWDPTMIEGLIGKGTSLYKTLKGAFHPDQITKDPAEADLCFSRLDAMPMDVQAKVLDPDTNREQINTYIF